ncbi:putative Agenet domain-containing protein / bromo-adjacent domain-containing protein [Melia azedarach]|uniref:Agenet domain-containing protein / bromo-adjacent domain-containing protein n=1 Tax=Melia azedarach TaxID=155640 RepID=A0ACC1YQ20_MELAZ|nr:putative Agenet domain-containing protein / bromo-adjacent domain-containing protein [Melia azedarach]
MSKFLEWKEEFVSQERGNRVVHYFLKDSAGESVLAVVGTERSVRHMFYVVAEEFVRVHGAENSIHAGYKWRSRREVVDWLTSMLSKQHLQSDRSKSPKHDSAQASGSTECPVNGIGARKVQVPEDMGHLSRNVNGQSSDIVWSGMGLQYRFNHLSLSWLRERIIMLPIWKICMKIRGDRKRSKLGGFTTIRKVKGVASLRNPHPKEVFITPHAQVISAECVDGPASVLTREHFDKCLAAFPNALLARIHLCTRQFRSNRLKPFDLSKLHGYYDQPILCLLNSSTLQATDSFCHGLTGDEDGLTAGENVKLGSKRPRRGRGSQRFLTDSSGVASGRVHQLMTNEPSYKKLKYGLSGMRLLSHKHIECQSWYSLVYKVDAKIELLCQDSGIRGCWFRCIVLQISRKQMNVRYDDVQDEDGYGNLEEWIPVHKVAMPDKLGMRCSGRPTIRPAPPCDQEDRSFDIGTAVDAWWSDGWWEGVVIGVDSSSTDNLQVYLPGESLFLNVRKQDLRISRDWMGDQWIDIEAKPDIISAISAMINPDNKLLLSSTIAKDVKTDGLDATKLETVEEVKPDLHAVVSSDSPPEDADCKNERKPPSLEQGKGQGVDDVNVVGDEVHDVQGNDENEDGDSKNNNEVKVEAEVFKTSGDDCRTSEVHMEVTA